MMTPEEYAALAKRSASLNRKISHRMKTPSIGKPGDPVQRQAELHAMATELEEILVQMLDYEVAKQVGEMTQEQQKARICELVGPFQDKLSERELIELAKLIFGPDGSFSREL